MQVLIPLLKGEGVVDSLKIRGKCIEGIGLIAGAVGASSFHKHSRQVMEILIQLETSNLPLDDPRVALLQRSWGRFARALRRDFVPYLNPLLPKILQQAALEADIKLLEEDEREDEKWQLIQLDLQNTLGVNTCVVREKNEAMSLLYWLTLELKEFIFPHIQQILPIVINALGFIYHDSVRMSAGSILPCLLRSTLAQTNNIQDVQNLFHYMLPNFIGAIENEIEEDVLLVYFDAFEEVSFYKKKM